MDCITINLSPASDPPTCQTSTQVLYTVALNSSVVLSCEMAAHPGGEEVTFSWSGNTSLITRHVVNMAASRKQSDTAAELISHVRPRVFANQQDSPHKS